MKTWKQIWDQLYVRPRRRRLMHRYGLEMIVAFDRALTRAGIPFSPVYGTLLGAIREKGFIPHDDDVDMGVWTDHLPGGLDALHRALEEEGFTLRRMLLVDDGAFAREETWKWKHVGLDIFFFDPVEGDTYRGYMFYPFRDTKSFSESLQKHQGLRVVEFDLPFAPRTERIPFETITLPATVTAEGFVVARYGLNWRIPDPTFVYPQPGVVGNRDRDDKFCKVVKL